MADSFIEDEEKKPSGERLRVLKAGVIGAEYETNDRFRPWDGGDPLGVHTTPELLECLKRNPNVEVEARAICLEKDTKASRRILTREQFLEFGTKQDTDHLKRLKEATDCFSTDSEFGGNIVGSPDFIPLMGGPYYKQLYFYDYIKMHSAAFYAYNHDPIARRVVHTMRDFTMGREWKLEANDKAVQALWDSFVVANDLYHRMDLCAQELSIYGEVFIWWLPGNATKIAYDVRPGQEPSKGLLPRIRLVDPSNFWEIITYPEDIERVLAYQWVSPTQSQAYTANDKGSSVGITKFIFQQIPANEIQHYKVNSVSNEKRGRSDLFPVLGYLKRLRDSVNYSIIALQKQAAWCIDTAVDGSQEDLDDYVASQEEIGSIPPAGSEFVHSKKVERTYLGNQGLSKSGGTGAFDWTIAMIAAGTGIPVQYLGTHLGGAQTRASAIVSTEPVAKMFEARQNVYKRIIANLFLRLCEMNGIKNQEHRIIFPELAVQDRTAKLRDLGMAQGEGWISQRRAAEIAAKELGVLDFSYDEERKEIEGDQLPGLAPLSTPGTVGPKNPDMRTPSTPTGISSKDKRSLDLNRGA